MIPQLSIIVRLAPLIILLLPRISYALDAKTLFNLAPGNAHGGCDNHLEDINFWLDESIVMAEVGIKALQVAQGKVELPKNGFDEKLYAGRLTYAFFRLDSSSLQEDWDAIQGRFESVQSFLNREAPYPGGEKPWLFCGTDYLVRQEPTDTALDSEGKPLPNSPTIQEEYGDLLVGGKVPWWNEYNHHYYFGDEDAGTACDNDPFMAAAADTSEPAPFLLFLCPDNINSEFMGNQERLGSLTPAEGTYLYKMRPRSINIFHELFHLTIGNAFTDDVTYTLGGIRNGVEDPDTIPLKKTLETSEEEQENAGPNTENETKLQMLRKNPETYAFFSTAYWYWTQTYQTGTDGKDQKAFFPADIATLIDWDTNLA
ncbi:uncharacterized protein BKCO1_5600071 [Diplodia corticola]|uniref:Uncharacterized protein n=1 Tax=Diplodia corticola TaxID=236234 RepID=A0A1J9RTE3_9PEZI|nr:uncharacterized protein BKCO1_5600071 [Diplodia corticola]OJD30797.1 hypothetical protein BKCO1_5600071 [Diplodia corticola]